MVAFGPPQLVRFGVDDKMGYTLVQLIETSNITGHFCESSNDAYIDIFSCKPYDKQVALGIVECYFEPKSMKHLLVERQAELK
jgi:S-adenosylmethionine/arginine decarboxylase-like enzyme